MIGEKEREGAEKKRQREREREKKREAGSPLGTFFVLCLRKRTDVRFVIVFVVVVVVVVYAVLSVFVFRCFFSPPVGAVVLSGVIFLSLRNARVRGARECGTEREGKKERKKKCGREASAGIILRSRLPRLV